MKEKDLLRADKLFDKLSKLAPCRSCLNDTCEECRWVIFASTRWERRWDHFNYFNGGHTGQKPE